MLSIGQSMGGIELSRNIYWERMYVCSLFERSGVERYESIANDCYFLVLRSLEIFFLQVFVVVTL